MCGIVGFVGKNVEGTLIDKLKKLEYRGYDSAGIAIGSKDGFNIFKAKGDIGNLSKIVKPNGNSAYGIGHTRWATHGKPDEINAHPHVSADGKWALVHNGIIENYADIKEKLQNNGMEFYSETDTETIAKLLQYYDCDDKLYCLEQTCSALKGSYALAILNSAEERIYFARNKSPLFIAVKGESVMLASDVICFSGFSDFYYAIDDGEFGYVDKFGIEIKNGFGKVNKTPVPFDANDFEEESEYDHLMIKEIFETKMAIKNALDYYSVKDNYENIYKIDVNGIDKIKLVGCGTAYHACLLGASFLAKRLDIDCDAVVASEFRYCDPKINGKTLVVLISQSGETADTLAAFELAKQKGAKTLALVNVEYSTLAKNVEYFMPIKAGVEHAVASTKAYSVQLVVLDILSLILESKKNGTPVDFTEIKRLYENFDYGKKEQYLQIAELLRYQSNMFMIGRGNDYCTAQEASLKIKETCYINSDTYFGGELKHGFLALIDSNTYIVVFATERKVLSKILSNAEEAHARGAKMILVTCFNDIDSSFLSRCEEVLFVKNFESPLQTVANIVPWQQIAYYTSINKGINPDRPRNLAKSVTVE